MEAIEYRKRLEQMFALQMQGLATPSMRFALRPVAPYKERAFREHDVLSAHRQPLQNSAGQAFYMIGYDPIGSPDHPIR